MFRDIIGIPGSEYSVDTRGLLIRTSPLDQFVQVVAPESLRKRIMYFSHNSVHAGHPGSSRMYSMLHCSYYWPNMAGNVQDYVSKYQSCLRTKGTRYRSRRKLRLFSATEPLLFVAFDLLGPLLKFNTCHEHILVITDRLTKLTHAIPLKSLTSQAVIYAFLTSWIYAYGLPDRVQSDNVPQFTACYFQHAVTSLNIKHVPTSTYHSQIKSQTERNNSTIAP